MSIADASIPKAILGQWRLESDILELLPVSGGLSGAQVWRCRTSWGNLCVRRWPERHPTPERLTLIHDAMTVARRAGLSFIPRLFPTAEGATFTTFQHRLWEVSEWMPGENDYLQHPSPLRLESAMQALADLHHVWRQWQLQLANSPTVNDRLQHLTAALQDIDSIRSSSISTDLGEIRELSQATLSHLQQRGGRLQRALEELAATPTALHPVIRDVWSDHLLFTGDTVAGIIDFGALRIDEPATDVVRLLSSLEPLDRQKWLQGWNTYHSRVEQLSSSISDVPPAGPILLPAQPDIQLARLQILDEAATLLSAIQWWRWLVQQPKEFSVPKQQLLSRWQHFIDRLDWLPHDPQ